MAQIPGGGPIANVLPCNGVRFAEIVDRLATLALALRALPNYDGLAHILQELDRLYAEDTIDAYFAGVAVGSQGRQELLDKIAALEVALVQRTLITDAPAATSPEPNAGTRH